MDKFQEQNDELFYEMAESDQGVNEPIEIMDAIERQRAPMDSAGSLLRVKKIAADIVEKVLKPIKKRQDKNIGLNVKRSQNIREISEIRSEEDNQKNINDYESQTADFTVEELMIELFGKEATEKLKAELNNKQK